METVLYPAIILVCSFILVKTVTLFISSTSQISQYYRISGYTVSFLLVSLATSLPEMVVAVTSALDKNPVLSYGNALGANMAMFTLVIAIAGFLSKGKGIATKRIFKSNDVYFSATLSLVAVAIALDGEITRFNGILLLLGYLFYAVAFIKRSTLRERMGARLENINVIKELLLFFLSLSVLIAASRGIVFSAVKFSEIFNVGVGFVGLTITAIGTTLPELSYSIALVKKNRQDEILGNVIGSVAANSTLILGIAAVIHPIEIVNGGISMITYAFTVLGTLLFVGFTKTKHKLDKTESMVLIAVYLGFLLAEYLIR